ncbi:MAG TPA: winged helix-turn-helix domain-containing protein [Bryobacteraceae bacterium]|jgi:DNA-binding winged helix-turn-helix (wHTH) protein/TolB-like protein/Flp pilus assembly protein TadD|nr:winged helix-turn-helix domain-containing protein [Bryobacteraceae bacterium]
MVLKTPDAYRFGPFRLEPGEHRLTLGEETLPLAPKSFELLVYFVENSGRLLLKDEIMQAIWPNSFVEEANLTVAISGLRKLLGKSEDGGQYIETVPKKGYRFTAPVQPLSSAGSPAHPVLPVRQSNQPHGQRLRYLLVLLVGLVLAAALLIVRTRRPGATPAAPAPHTLAVLPLKNVKNDADSDFLGFSLADAVITKLGSLHSLAVRPSSAVEKYRGRLLNIPAVASDLQVDTLLTGNFIRDHDTLRITYQLIDAASQKILDNDTLDLKYDRLFTVQDEVAQWIVKGLQLHLSPGEAALMRSAEPVVPLAYEYYLRGIDLVSRHQFPLAIGMLERSAAIDPNHALTWAYLGYCYTSDAAFELGGREQYSKARDAEQHALALDPNQLEATMFLANLLIDTGQVEQAVPLLRKALQNNPEHAGLRWELGYAYRFGGMLQESAAECERARRIDPSVRGNGAVLNAYLYLGEYEKFLQSLPDINDSGFFLFYRGFGKYHKQEFDSAAEDFERAYQLHSSLYTQVGLALADGIRNKRREGLQVLHELEEKMQQRRVGDGEGTYKIAQAYAVLGDVPSGLRALRDSIQAGFFSYPYMIRDPLLANLRRDPRLPRLLKLAEARHQEFRRRFF